jgi:hypothetical protein
MAIDTITGGGDFRVGDVLNRAWQVFIRNILFFVGITLLVYLAIFLPIGVFGVLLVLAGMGSDAWWLIAIGIVVAALLFIVLNTIGQAVLLFGTFQRLRGQPLRVGEALRRAFARFFPLVGLGILYSLGLMVGLLLLVIPGVVVFVMWTVAVPACVVEGYGPVASLSRSAELTKGFRWKVFALVLVLSLINGIGGQFFETLLGMAGAWASAVGSVAWFVAWTSLWNCALIMIYHDLRVAKEGIDTEQIAAIFD